MSHTCNSLLLTCIDFRFNEAIRDWAKEQGLIKDFDLVSLAGAQKNFLDEDTKSVALKQLEISSRLHGIKTVLLVAHQDCGAYGGSKAFASWDEEKAKYAEDLEKAESLIKERFSILAVRKLILTFDANMNVELKEILKP
ncbi:hypothetical protein A2482_04505 [Candidatus Falkowbacteria bacterium RIFOXYC2_FULL_48_21]|uniref:Carbonic anhydrase n=1 Tax=Candidatus Falkowbacteria bacterium RIFOXYC2_FULL_48_21 TaxID=1798005 RepID=A0A1F5T9Q3_9BACT|nr:MAG: hypothetical protein A2482_04505 [Candidatus Falkowbacteria bacterium RIFOXYC2_FULL_48_21]